jgi:hypothetical protein
VQDQLENEDFIACSTSVTYLGENSIIYSYSLFPFLCFAAEEREKLSEGLAAASLWMEEEAHSAVAADCNTRVAALNVTTAAILYV